MKLECAFRPVLAAILCLSLSLGTLSAKDKKDDTHHKKDDKKEHHRDPEHGRSHSSHHEAPKVTHHSDDRGHSHHTAPKVERHDEHKVHHEAPIRSAEPHRMVRHSDSGPRKSHSAPKTAEHHVSHSQQERHVVAHRDSSRDHHPGHTEHGAHHTPQWYRSNGWHHDGNYWSSHRQHRFFDDDGCVIFEDSTEPDYAIGFDAIPQARAYVMPEVAYDDGGPDYETRAAVQEKLYRIGYYDGDIDGVIGPGTRRAISDFQSDHGLRLTGWIDGALLDELGL